MFKYAKQLAAGGVCATLMFSQLSWVYSQAYDNAAGLTSALTSPITFPENPIVTPTPSATPTITPTPAPANNNNGNNSNNNGSSNNSGGSSQPSAPSCNDSKPTKAPVLLGYTTTSKNQVTLTWSKALDPVTHYLISYGVKPNIPLYGNPNIGDKNTTHYTVNALSGGVTYYFRVRAINNCTPGDYSNEIAVKVGGRTINSPAQGFRSGVLSVQKVIKSEPKKFKSSPAPTQAPSNNTKKEGNSFFNFIKKINPFN